MSAKTRAERVLEVDWDLLRIENERRIYLCVPELQKQVRIVGGKIQSIDAEINAVFAKLTYENITRDRFMYGEFERMSRAHTTTRLILSATIFMMVMGFTVLFGRILWRGL